MLSTYTQKDRYEEWQLSPRKLAKETIVSTEPEFQILEHLRGRGGRFFLKFFLKADTSTTLLCDKEEIVFTTIAAQKCFMAFA